ncbi:MAG: hypothetical protein HYZ53_28100 [Planctomycetes bacterium]|nr:hypothetical protein [Planctomycetota bacterium]
MESPAVKNEYLQQVQAQQAKVARDLKVAAPAAAQMAAEDMAFEAAEELPRMSAGGGGAMPGRFRMARVARGFAPELGEAPHGVRITGLWRWQTVIVPPNAYVVHTRRDRVEPLHIGLGLSFAFNPYRDSFLVVPSTMQTILINAHCVCKELQGLLVQGYVQWIIADFANAYKKLDFSDVRDPMGVVNVQLREQAEAAIKDKVATMGIDDVLSDKQPIIAELTARLRHVAEGEGNTDRGLGLRIVTVQVKEAVVCSSQVWENLQKPFRAQRAQVARLAELESEAVVKARELEQSKERTTRELRTQVELANLRGAAEAEAFDREQAEAARRQVREAELRVAQTAREAEVAEANARLEQVRLQKEAELARARQREELARKEAAAKAELSLRAEQEAAANRQAEAELGLERTRQGIRNDLSPAQVQARVLEALPAIAERLPRPTELRSVSIGGAGGPQDGQGMAGLVAQVLAVLEAFRGRGAGAHAEVASGGAGGTGATGGVAKTAGGA